MGLFDDFGANKNKQTDGVWVEYDGYKIKIAYAGEGNTLWEKALEKHTGRLRTPFGPLGEKRKKKLTDREKDEISEALAGAYAEAVIRDWEGIRRGTEEIPYSFAAAKEILLELPAFFQEVRDYAGTLANYQDVALEEDAKNS